MGLGSRPRWGTGARLPGPIPLQFAPIWDDARGVIPLPILLAWAIGPLVVPVLRDPAEVHGTQEAQAAVFSRPAKELLEPRSVPGAKSLSRVLHVFAEELALAPSEWLEALVCQAEQELELQVGAPLPASTQDQAASTQDQAPTTPPGPQGQIRRLEYFAIQGSAQGDPEALVALRSYTRFGSEVLEEDTLFRDSTLVTAHHEEIHPCGARLVWRELAFGQGQAHTLIADGLGGPGPVKILRHGLRAATHHTIETASPELRSCVGMLTLLEALRASTSALPSRVFVTETGRIEPFVVQRVNLDLVLGWNERWVGVSQGDWLRIQTTESGTLRDIRLIDKELVAFRWRPRAPWALPIEESSFQATATAWRALARPKIAEPRVRAFEAAAPFLDKSEHTRPVWFQED